jgi:cytochrome c oxidase subunit I+III
MIAGDTAKPKVDNPATAVAEAGMEGLDRFARLDQPVLGVLLFILSEVVFFAFLIIAYVYFRDSPAVANGPNAKSVLLDSMGQTVIFTICLFASSGTIWMADRSIARGNEGGFRLWLAATILLGGTFLVGQALEYYHLLTDNITISRNLFGTTFFTLTGFHGLHVLVGLIALLIILGLALAGQFKGQRHNGAVQAVSFYWHFVDVVWVFVFSIVYLWALF